MLTRLASAVAIVLLAASCNACDASHEAAAAERAAAPRREAFRRFDAWARRAVLAQSAFRNTQALEETLWAPVRGDRDVVEACVRGPDRPTLLLRGGTWPEPDKWYSLRDTVLHRIRVSETTLDDQPSVLLAHGPEDGVEVLMAFERDDEAP